MFVRYHEDPKKGRNPVGSVLVGWFFIDYTTVSNVSSALLCSAVLVSAITDNDLICCAELVGNVRADTNAALKGVQKLTVLTLISQAHTIGL